MKKFAGHNFIFDENGRKFIKKGKKHSGKGRNCLFRAFSPFPTVFSIESHCRHVKTRACLERNKFLSLSRKYLEINTSKISEEPAANYPHEGSDV